MARIRCTKLFGFYSNLFLLRRPVVPRPMEASSKAEGLGIIGGISPLPLFMNDSLPPLSNRWTWIPILKVRFSISVSKSAKVLLVCRLKIMPKDCVGSTPGFAGLETADLPGQSASAERPGVV